MVQNGDKVTIDADNRVIDVHLSEAEWETRKAAWEMPAYKATRGTLWKYIKVVKNERAAQWIIVTHERRFARYPADLRRYRGRKILHEKVLDGTPIWTVYEVSGGR